MASTYLSRTPSSAGNRKTWTFSAWIKRSKLSIAGSTILFGANSSAGSNDEDAIAIEEANNPRFLLSNGGASSIKPSRLLRDTSAWYHIVVAVDTTQATASNRVKFYFNGELETSFSQESYPSQNYDCKINNNVPQGIGFIDDIAGGGSSTYFDGSMSHVHFIDGTAYDASAFGEYDANGVWKIKTDVSVTYGTNGFFILKDGNSVTDQSGNGNNWTVAGGTLTNTEDNPSNVFATWNVLAAHSSNKPTFSNGNTTVVGVDTSSQTVSSTLAMPSKGKYYCEMKLTQEANATSSIPNFGIIDAASLYKARNQELISYTSVVNSYAGRVNSANMYADGADTGNDFSDTPDVGDIIGLAVDLDSAQNTLKYYLNGTLIGTQNINNDEYVFACSIKNDTNAGQVDVNFGNGYFGTTAVASAGTNASGIGIFEYDVPTGYTALSTKGLNL